MTTVRPKCPVWRRNVEAAHGYLALRMLDAAAAELARIIPHADIETTPMLLRLRLLSKLRRWVEMRDLAAALRKLQPRENLWAAEWVQSVSGQQGPLAGLVALDQVEPDYPVHPRLLWIRIHFLWELKRYKEAELWCDRANDLDPSYYDVLERERDAPLSLLFLDS